MGDVNVGAVIQTAFTFGLGWFMGSYMRQMRVNRRARRQRLRSSSLRTVGRCVAVVTTAALPWRTGTSINPVLRAAHLAHQDPTRKVLLVIPWLAPEEQPLLFPAGLVLRSRDEQRELVLAEARQRTGLPCSFEVVFYDGKYFPQLGSIFPLEDITRVIPAHLADAVVLEEPEHLTWMNHTSRWVDKFSHVVGIMHTNYLAYVSEGQATGMLNAAVLYRVNRWMCRIHCHKVIKLSDAVQELPHSTTCNVHGVAAAFLEVGRAKAKARAPRFTKGAYFIGKAVWGKGYRELLTLLHGHQLRTARAEPIDVIGSGEDLRAIQAEAEALGLAATFLGAKDHADPPMHDYKVFINPSLSDVVATTTAEALAMGKWVVVQDIPCNAFFAQFPNCLMYDDAAGFSRQLTRALAEEPTPMDEATLSLLSWEAATERLLDVAELGPHDWQGPEEARYTRTLWRMYRSVVGFKVLRAALGMDKVTPEDRPAEDASEVLEAVATMDGEGGPELDWIFQGQ